MVRAELTAAKDKTFDELRCAHTTEPGIWGGNVPLYKLEELRAKLSAVDIQLTVPAHEESEPFIAADLRQLRWLVR